jgi:cation transport ATPase
VGIRYVSTRGIGANHVRRPYNVRVYSMRWLLRSLAVFFVVPAGYVAFTVVRAAVASELGAVDLLFGISTLAAFVIGVWILLDLSATVEDF